MNDKNNLLKKAKKIVKKYNTTSISFLQRKLGVGYNKAGILMNIIQKEKL